MSSVAYNCASFVNIPPGLAGVPMVVGVDEAGRGPVIGPLVYGAAFWPLDRDAEMSKAGFDDSKALSEADRDRLFQKMGQMDCIGWVIKEISADYISTKMQQPTPVSLNLISHDAVIDMLHTLRSKGVCISEVYVDTVGDAASYESKLTAEFDDAIKFTVAKKADSLYKCVSAASIAAKVHRDKVIREWTFVEGGDWSCDWGSGYPGDERAKTWLQTNAHPVFGYPNVVRFSWSTTKEVLKTLACPCEWECDEEEEDDGMQPITAFFSNPNPRKISNTNIHKRKRTEYFMKRRLQRVDNLDLITPTS